MPKKKKAKAKGKKEEVVKLSKEEEFAYKYLENGGNATEAAMQVFNASNRNSAHAMGCKYLRKVTVQKIIHEWMEAERGVFAEQQKKRREIVLNSLDVLNSVILDSKVPFKEKMPAIIAAYRLEGIEIDPMVLMRRASQEAHAVRHGLPAVNRVSNLGDNRRLTVFHMQAPAVPPGGKPTPALLEQWKRQGVELPEYVEDNEGNGSVDSDSDGVQ